MGRRRSTFSAVLRDLERSVSRAAAEGRRRERREEAAQGRAIEREIVREERARDRERIREERAAERRRVSDEREQAQRSKQAAKERQLRAWQLEHEENVAHETEIERIANDGPEVEGRDLLYRELAERRTFEPEPFILPHHPTIAKFTRELQERHEAEISTAVLSFRPDLGSIRRNQIVATTLAVLGAFIIIYSHSGAILLGFAIMLGCGGYALFAQVMTGREAARQLTAFQAQIEQDAADQIDQAVHAQELRNQHDLQNAKTKHAAAAEAARAEFEQKESERLLAVSELMSGNTERICEALGTAFPLDLPVPCSTKISVDSSVLISIQLDVPEPSVIPASESKLLASGKVSYKEKNEKRIREQYLRLVTGLAFRHASETMLIVPTCHTVELCAYRTMLDRSRGNTTRQPVLEAQFDYSTLAPLTMDGLDPRAALKHFSHRINVDQGIELLALDATE